MKYNIKTDSFETVLLNNEPEQQTLGGIKIWVPTHLTEVANILNNLEEQYLSGEKNLWTSTCTGSKSSANCVLKKGNLQRLNVAANGYSSDTASYRTVHFYLRSGDGAGPLNNWPDTKEPSETYFFYYLDSKDKVLFWGIDGSSVPKPSLWGIENLKLTNSAGLEERQDYDILNVAVNYDNGFNYIKTVNNKSQSICWGFGSRWEVIDGVVAPKWPNAINSTFSAYSPVIELIPFYDNYNQVYSERLFFAPLHSGGVWDPVKGAHPGPVKIGNHYYLRLAVISCQSNDTLVIKENGSFFYLIS